MSVQTRSVRLGFTDELFPASTHMCYIFKDEQERKNIIAKFMKSGADSKERISYFADRISKEELCHCLSDLGIDAEALAHNGQLLCDLAETVYCPDSHFCACRMLSKLGQAYQKSLDDGFVGLRVSGEMDWVLAAEDRIQELLIYEAQVNDLIEIYPTTAICQYDANKFDASLLHQVLEVHPFMVVRGQVVCNPYYVRSAELSGC